MWKQNKNGNFGSLAIQLVRSLLLGRSLSLNIHYKLAVHHPPFFFNTAFFIFYCFVPHFFAFPIVVHLSRFSFDRFTLPHNTKQLALPFLCTLVPIIGFKLKGWGYHQAIRTISSQSFHKAISYVILQFRVLQWGVKGLDWDWCNLLAFFS